jgi:transcriptional regulator with XRE-family HTH domain
MNKIKLLRLQDGLTQTDLAKRMNVAQNTVSAWEKGKTEPDIEMLKKLAACFDTTIDDVIGDSSDPAPAAKKAAGFQPAPAYMMDTSGLSDEDRKALDEYVELLRFRAMARASGESAKAGPAAYAK